MVTQQLRKVGNSYVITVPKDEVERLHLSEGDYVTADFRKMELRPVLDPEVQRLFDADINVLKPMLEYLKDK
ncbi:MAG: AbrB/MazE/SpoVT family DNA-binding domain-containing protein [Thermomicrobiales bacterium]|nr:AbrB/MazE/SpoVT family DNA-binding domain-containing protein [Thermomicrobiales bacterium]